MPTPKLRARPLEDPTERLTPAQRLEVASRILARRNLIYFIKRFYPAYEAGWVHEDIARRLERFSHAVVAKQSPRLMLLMPPRAGKSELASIRFPAWHLGHNPTHEVINCGYNLDLPMKFSRKVRELARDPAFKVLFSQCVIDPESQSAEAWNTTLGGGFTAAGVGGGITGKGAHVLIIDDPLKNQEEADSALIRDSLWDWYWSTAYTRLSPGGGVLIIQTCWHDDDLAGRLQQKGREDQFEVVKYPALAEQWEYLHTTNNTIERFHEPLNEHDDAFAEFRFLRAPGEALHPARYDERMLNAYKANMPPRVWSALYQQNPVPDEGAYFRRDWFKFEPDAPVAYNCYVFQAWDFAIGEKQTNDYTVGATLLLDPGGFLHLLEVVRFRGDSFDIVENVIDAVVRWGSEPTAPLTLGFEDGQIWRSIRPLLLARCAERRVFPSYEELKPLTDKMARAKALQGRLQQGRLYLPLNKPWQDTVIGELLRFPAGAHDDIVDALAHAVNLCVGKTPKHLPGPKPLPSWKDKVKAGVRGVVSHMAA